MKSSILNNTCIRVNRDELQIERCNGLLACLDTKFADMANTVRLAGNEVRLKILMLINAEERLCVCDLSDVLQMKIPAVSQHLRKLKDAGIVETQREGTLIYYNITKRNLSNIEALLQLIPQNQITIEV